MSEDFKSEAFQKRIEQMTESELVRQGKTAAEFAKVGFAGFPPEQVCVRQLEMCRAEWRRRHPKSAVLATTVDHPRH